MDSIGTFGGWQIMVKVVAMHVQSKENSLTVLKLIIANSYLLNPVLSYGRACVTANPFAS